MSTITNARRGAWPGPHAARNLQHLTSALMVLVLVLVLVLGKGATSSSEAKSKGACH
jgi:hypothetical protein